MTLTADAPSGTAADGSRPETARQAGRRRWRQWRLVVGLGLALVVVAVLTVALTQASGGRALDPTTATPDGARAVAQVLADQGVDVVPVARAAEAAEELSGSGDAVVVVDAAVLDPDLLAEVVADADDVVLVAPDAIVLGALEAPVRPAGVVSPGEDADGVEAGCDGPAAAAAGEVSAGGTLYRALDGGDAADDGDVQVCYPAAGEDAGTDGGSWATWTRDGTTYTAVGQPAWVVNDTVDLEGNAALALWSLGGQDRLVWWMADPLDGVTSSAPPSPADLLPGWVPLVGVQLLLVAVIAVLWKARRLGRLVPEPLPVVVRSAETARGRAALYRRAGARDRAAAVLRADVLRRLAPRFGLAPGASADEVARSAAAAAGLPAGEVQHLLLGPPPATDLELTGLADRLDELLARFDRPR